MYKYRATKLLPERFSAKRFFGMNLDAVFGAMSDPMRRRLLDELTERDGQTLFELHVRLIQWRQADLTRQGLSRRLFTLERAGLV